MVVDHLGKAAADTADGQAKQADKPSDKANRVAADRWVWCPTHTSRQAWDLFMLTLIVYSCVAVPYRIGMGVDAEGGEEEDASPPELLRDERG